MKRYILATAIITATLNMWGATGTKTDPIPLTDGKTAVDFGDVSSKFYSYTPATDEMLTFSELDNVNIYGFQITPTDKLYTESFNGTTYVQTVGRTTYTIEVTKGYASGSASFVAGHYSCAWPDGDSWSNPIIPFERMSYIPITLDLPSHLRYTAQKDGMLEMKFSAYISLSCSTSPTGTFAPVTTTYVSGGGYRGIMPVSAGETYYFTLTAPSSPLCSFSIVEVEPGKSPDLPYTLQNGSTGIFPKEAGKYYYAIANDPNAVMMVIKGNAPFKGTAEAGTSFTYFTAKSVDNIGIRMAVSPYETQYCLVLTRDTASESDQTFTVDFTSEAYDDFPGQPIAEGETTTPDGSGVFYYTFTVPTDGRKIIQISPVSPADGCKASVYYSDNKYTALATGSSIEYEAVAGRAYTVAWEVAPEASPLTFNLGFVAPARGESADNPIPATLGENTAPGGLAVYFRYYATVDGWLIVKPAPGLKMPAVSMLPIPSDPYMQACDVIPYGDGYRVATEKDRGYLIIFFGADAISFDLSELTALEGEAPTNPFIMTDDTVTLPAPPATYWYSYTAPQDGKLVISTNLPFQQSVNHQDYTYVQIYDPDDTNNRIAQLRPDYDLGIFDEKVIDTTAGTEYLIKVCTLVNANNRWIKCVVRDPVDGEIPSRPIEIPFDGNTITYDFNRMVNSEADAIWYGITLPEGYFNLKGISGGTFALTLFAQDDTDEPLTATEVLDVDYDELNEMYIYLWGIANYHVTAPGRYLLKLTDNEVPFTATIEMATSGIDDALAEETAVTTFPGAIRLTSPAAVHALIYTIDGKLFRATDFIGETTITLPNGIYIVRLGSTTAKVAVK